MTPAARRGTSFDRVRPREPVAPKRDRSKQVDVEGKRALFSSAPSVPAFGSLSVECGGCRQTTILAPNQALRAVLPSLHLPLLRRNRSYLRCPACGRWEWCHLTLRV